MLQPETSAQFLVGGGEMGASMRAHDWRASPLGAPVGWPQPLKTLVGVMLGSNQAMFVAWGVERIMLYNDRYADLLQDRHPAALGQSFAEVWWDIMDDVGPILDRAFAGEATHMDDIAFILTREGRSQEAHFAFSYTPVRDEAGAVAGTFCACSEITGQVFAERRIVAERDRQRKLFEQAPGFITILSGPELRFEFVNDAYDRLFGRRGFVGKTVREAFPDLAGQPFFDLLDNAYATGERFVAHTIPIRLQATPDAEPTDHFLDFIYEPVRDESGAVTGLFIEGHDVTERVRAEGALTEAEHRLSAAVNAAGLSADFRALFEASPTPFLVVAPPDWTIVAANDARIEVAGVSREAQIGRKLFDLFPDDPDDPTADGVKNLTASFERVIATGKGDAMAIQRYAVQGPDGHFVERWWSPVNSPVLDRDGAVTLIIHRVEDVTETVRLRGEAAARDQLSRDQQAVIDLLHASEAALRESEARQVFLLSLSDMLRSLGSPLEIASAAAEQLGERFDLSRVFYAQYFGSVMRVERDFTRGVESIVGEHDLAAFGPELLRAYHECAIVKVDDVGTDARFSEEARAGLRARQVGAYLDVVLFENEQWVSLLAFQSTTPRTWTTAEQGLFREVGERVKSAIERARAEQQLRELNETLEARVEERTAERDRMWETSPDLMLIIDFEGVFRRVNAAWTTVLGYTSEELVGHHVNKFVMPDDHSQTIDAYELAAAGGRPTIENRYRHKDGSTRWISWTAAPAGELTYATGRDITLDKQREAELAERSAQLQLYQNIVTSNPNPILAFDADLRVTAFNQAHADKFYETQGVRSEIGHRFPDHFIPEERSDITALMTRALTGEMFTSRVEFGDPSYAKLHWDIHYSPLRDADGAIVGASHHAIEVTAQVKAELALAASQDALRQSQKMEAMGTLTGGVAHDFNNLLTPIIGSLDMLVRKGVGSDRERRLIDGALQSAERAKTLVQRLLAFARRQPLQPVAVDVPRLVEGMTGLIGATLGPTIDILVDLASDLPAARADPNQLEMALLNLAVNARDAMPDGGRLTIEAKRESITGMHRSGAGRGHYVRLSVSDTGVGMNPATLDRAVEPFFSTKGIGKGTGLGLSMVHGLAAQLGGGLTIDSTPGNGTSIDLWLPISAHVPGDKEEQVATAMVRRGRGLALLVDDEELVRMSTADMLVDLGFEVVEAGSGAEALGLMEAGTSPDLLITDHLMPGMTGADLASRARSLNPALPILVVSGYAEVEGIAPDLPRLTKPFRNAELAASLASLIPALGDEGQRTL